MIAEYKRKLPFINTLIAQGLSPDEFNANYNWDAFFETKFEEAKKTSLVKSTLLTLFKAMLPDDIKEAFGLNDKKEGQK